MATTNTATEVTMTPTEQKLLAAAWQCFEGTPNIDFEKLAHIMGHTNFRTTKNMMGGIRKKLNAVEGGIIPVVSPKKNDDGTTPVTPTKTKAKPKSTPKTTPKKRGADNTSDEEASDDAATPAKDAAKASPTKPSPKKRNKKEIKAEEADEVA